MDWVHCNSCNVLAKQSSGKVFNLTSCGHIYCSNCAKSNTSNTCKVCGSNYTLVLLNSDLKPEIKEYFKNPEEVLKRALQIVVFQTGHQRQLYIYHETLTMKYKAAKQEIMKLNSILVKKDKQIKDLNHQYMLMKQKLQKALTQPTYNNNINVQVPFNNTKPTPKPLPLLPYSQMSNSQPGHWLTPKRLTLNKTTPSSCGSSGNSNITISPVVTPNFNNIQRPTAQYTSESNTSLTPTSLPGSSESPTWPFEKNMNNSKNTDSVKSKMHFTSPTMHSADRLFNKLTLKLERPRGK
ncbi:hypothetical protein C0J52_04470 [Blattella germanica]|nr:hypothetical protein C0J52_04470 [Blattella germanica]